MQFTRAQAVSFKPFDNGDYIGVIVGFSYIGTHDSGKWGPQKKCMIRWEIHNMDSPHGLYVDEEGLTHVVTQDFTATINGDQSWLYKCLVAHGIIVPGCGMTDSKEWHGKAAILTVEQYQGTKNTYMNVTNIKALPHEVNITPKLTFEHWEAEDTVPPPQWAKFKLEASTDLYNRTSEKKVAPANQAPATQTAYRPPDSPVRQETQSYSSGGGGGGGGGGLDDDDNNDIPF